MSNEIKNPYAPVEVTAQELETIFDWCQCRRRFEVGTAAGCPSDGGLVRRVREDRIVLQKHIGHGQFKTVAWTQNDQT